MQQHNVNLVNLELINATHNGDPRINVVTRGELIRVGMATSKNLSRSEKMTLQILDFRWLERKPTFSKPWKIYKKLLPH